MRGFRPDFILKEVKLIELDQRGLQRRQRDLSQSAPKRKEEAVVLENTKKWIAITVVGVLIVVSACLSMFLLKKTRSKQIHTNLA